MYESTGKLNLWHNSSDLPHSCTPSIKDNKQTNLAKFEALDEVFEGKVVASVYDRFTQALNSFSRGF